FHGKEHQQPQEDIYVFCGEELVVLSSSAASSHGRRYVACGRMPKCRFFEWIDDDEAWKNRVAKPRGGRVRCFCGEPLTLRTFGTARNPNRMFISCPNRRCKFFEWVDGDYETKSATRTRRSVGSDAGILGTQQHSGGFEDEIRKLESQKMKMERSSVEIKKLKVDLEQLDAGVERMCAELNVVQEHLGRLESNLEKQNKIQLFMLFFFVVLIVILCCGKK
ncbi:hypothetical protein PIB30_094872, partial [Stylosanthes scabra]|nr:hypothetical protein [Stylosanthes scabra]